MSLQGHITIHVNGEDKEVASDLTVTALLEQMGLNAGRVAVEYNRAILPRQKWPETSIASGDRFEIVQFVGGG
ncbi:MAG TPA: sulfur carrier protein ThiS [Candidatus Saccharimonadales bacterium]|nr:sulfur carrier protein ThiS [Candidatus Saccharimonadales bacterium]